MHGGWRWDAREPSLRRGDWEAPRIKHSINNEPQMSTAPADDCNVPNRTGIGRHHVNGTGPAGSRLMCPSPRHRSHSGVQVSRGEEGCEERHLTGERPGFCTLVVSHPSGTVAAAVPSGPSRVAGSVSAGAAPPD